LIAKELEKLTKHMFWADNEVWKVVLSNEKASQDENVKRLLFHYHMTQFSFCQVWTGKTFTLPPNEEFSDIKSIEKYKDDSNKQLKEYLRNIDELKLDKELDIPWSKYFLQISGGKESVPSTLVDSILQVVMHSTYHRAQVNRRLRELEIEPPIVDYIFWLWGGQPGNE